MVIDRVTVRPNTSNNPARPNGLVLIRGAFLTMPDPPVLDTFDVASGVVFRIEDALQLDVTTAPSFAPADCAAPTASGMIRCKSPDGTLSATFRPTSPGGPVFLINLKWKRVDTPPALFGPIRVTMTHAVAVERIGDATSCLVTTSALTCRTP